ncbi:TPA: hypothetical protein ACH3X2_009140 [Trebouxia sp. C0005]
MSIPAYDLNYTLDRYPVPMTRSPTKPTGMSVSPAVQPSHQGQHLLSHVMLPPHVEMPRIGLCSNHNHAKQSLQCLCAQVCFVCLHHAVVSVFSTASTLDTACMTFAFCNALQ